MNLSVKLSITKKANKINLSAFFYFIFVSLLSQREFLEVLHAEFLLEVVPAY